MDKKFVFDFGLTTLDPFYKPCTVLVTHCSKHTAIFPLYNSAKTSIYSSKLTGFSTRFLKADSHCAPTAPSTTR